MSITLLFILVAACLLFFLAAGFRFCSPLSVGVCLILSTMSDASVRLEVSRIKGQDDLPVVRIARWAFVELVVYNSSLRTSWEGAGVLPSGIL